jgi:uroporphyrinogen-III synthase
VNLRDLLPSDLPVYVVGPATARALRRLELPCQIIGDGTGNGEALAVFMLKHYNSLRQGANEPHWSKPGLLFMVGEQRRDIIPKSLMSESLPLQERIDVEELTVYETGVMASFADDFAQLVLPHLQKKELQWVIVFSPTGCKAMLEVLGVLDETSGKVSQGEQGKLQQTYIATIGPTTRDFLRTELGFEPDVCAEVPSAEGLGEGMLAFEKSSSAGNGR